MKFLKATAAAVMAVAAAVSLWAVIAIAQQADVTPNGRIVVVPHSWQDTFTATGNVDNTTDVSIVGARVGRKHCVTGVSISTLATLGADFQFRILSNDTVIWNCALDAAALNGCSQDFLIPVCTAAGEALEVDASGDPTDDLIWYNLQGYTTP